MNNELKNCLNHSWRSSRTRSRFVFLGGLLICINMVLVADGLGQQPAPVAGQPSQGADQSGQFAKIADAMLMVSRQLQQSGLTPATVENQRRIVDELEALVEKLAAQTEGDRAVAGDSADAATAPESSTGNTGAAVERPIESTAESSGISTASPEQTNQHLVDRAWGNLPEQIRQRLRPGSPPQFLPQYEAMIRQYYRRMSK